MQALVKEFDTDRLHLSVDQLCYLTPGLKPGSPTGQTRVKDALRELESAGLISNPAGEVHSCSVANPTTGKRTRDSFILWRVHDQPADDYAGWRSVAAKFNAYTSDWRERAKEQAASCVYAIGKPGSSCIKIGTSRDVDRRLNQLQAGDPSQLAVLWQAPGGAEVERALHERFAGNRLHGEWFDFGPQRDAVREIQAAADEMNSAG